MRRISKILRGTQRSRQRRQSLGTPVFEPLEPRLLLDGHMPGLLAGLKSIGPPDAGLPQDAIEVESFFAFNCRAVFAKTTFGGDSESDTETAGSAQETDQQETQDQQAASESADPERSDEAHQARGEESEPEAPAAEESPAEETAAEEAAEQAVETDTNDFPEQAAPVEEEPAEEEVADEQESATEQEPEAFGQEEDAAADAGATDDVAAEEVAAPDQGNEPAGRGVSQTIQKMTQSLTVLTDKAGRLIITKGATIGDAGELLGIRAKDIMQKSPVRTVPGDAVQQALAKIRQHDVGDIMKGHDGVLQAVVSKSDIAGAISPYLRATRLVRHSRLLLAVRRLHSWSRRGRQVSLRKARISAAHHPR